MNVLDPPTATSETSSTSTRPLPPPNRRRDKPQLSCSLCRKRKLRCNRGQPCEACFKRGLSLSCTYVHQSNSSDQSDGNEPKPTVYLRMQENISQLENLVISQIQIGNSSSIDQALNTKSKGQNVSAYSPCAVSNRELDLEVPPQSTPDPLFPVSRLNTDKSGTSHAEGTPWTAILDSVNKLKMSLEGAHGITEAENVPDEPDILTELQVNGPSLLFGRYKTIGKLGVLAAIPSRPIVDQLISTCFKSVEIAPVILHSPTFLNEYDRFWDSPRETPLLWLGQLFGMMGLAILHQPLTSLESNQQSDLQRQIQVYREKICQCLVLGDYTKAAPFTIETLLLYAHMEYLIKNEADTELWILLGIIVRLALRMGYHRDASHLHQISPFQSEMRRRIWAVIFMMDATASAQFNLPRMIRASQSNAQEPCNFLDEDIWENMTQLPPVRPDSIQTPIQFLLVKNKLISAASKVLDLSTLVQQPQYAEILRLDGILHNAFDSIPHWLTMRSMTKSIIDTPGVIIQRIQVALTYYRAKCLLHRPFILRAKKDTRYVYSRTAGLEASHEILKIQQLLNQETQVGGRLHENRGLISSFVKNDFLLATTILCVDVSHTLSERAIHGSQALTSRVAPAPSEETLTALSDAYLIWSRSGSSSQEAHKTARILKGVLERVQQWKESKSIIDSPRTLSTSTTASNGNTSPQINQAAHIPFLIDSNTVNARLTASNPTFLPFIPANTLVAVPELSEMDFEIGNWWDSEDFTPPSSHKPDSDPRTFGWILPGGGNHDAF